MGQVKKNKIKKKTKFRAGDHDGGPLPRSPERGTTTGVCRRRSERGTTTGVRGRTEVL
jgi:hypothetical protein